MRPFLGPHSVERKRLSGEMHAQDTLERRERGSVRPQSSIEGMATATLDELDAAQKEPSLRSAQQLVSTSADQVATFLEQRLEARMVAQLRLASSLQQTTALIDQQRYAARSGQSHEFARRNARDVSGLSVVCSETPSAATRFRDRERPS